MNKNNSICIKINNWFQYDKVSSIFFFIIINFNNWFFKQNFRQHFFLSLTSYRSNFNSWFFRNQTKFLSTFIFIIDSYRSTSDQLIFSKSNEIFVNIHFYHWFIQINIWSVNFFKIKQSFRQHSFLLLIHTDQHLIN